MPRINRAVKAPFSHFRLTETGVISSSGDAFGERIGHKWVSVKEQDTSSQWLPMRLSVSETFISEANHPLIRGTANWLGSFLWRRTALKPTSHYGEPISSGCTVNERGGPGTSLKFHANKHSGQYDMIYGLIYDHRSDEVRLAVKFWKKINLLGKRSMVMFFSNGVFFCLMPSQETLNGAQALSRSLDFRHVRSSQGFR